MQTTVERLQELLHRFKDRASWSLKNNRQPAALEQLAAFAGLAALWPVLLAFPLGDIPHSSTCRIASRVDGILWRLRGKPTAWEVSDGLLKLFHQVRYSNGRAGGVGARSHFPGWFFIGAAELANNFPGLRWVLDA